MKNLSWLLIALAAVSTLLGGVLHLLGRPLLSPPYGYWMIAVVLLLFVIAIKEAQDLK